MNCFTFRKREVEAGSKRSFCILVSGVSRGGGVKYLAENLTKLIRTVLFMANVLFVKGFG